MFRSSRLVIAALAFTVILGGVSISFAQDDPQAEKTAMYEKFLACRKDPDEAKRKVCLDGAREYMKKYGDADLNADDEANKQIAQYVQNQIKKYDDEQAWKALVARYENSIKDPAKVNAEDAFSAGREILVKLPDDLDIPITLATIGLDKYQSATPVDKYNADTLMYAKRVIDKINGGATSKNYGNFTFAYKTPQFQDGKNNTLGWMNYTVGWLMYYAQGQKKDALAYLYKASTFNSGAKKDVDLYRTIADWYYSQLVQLNQDAKAKIAANTDGKLNDEIKGLVAMQRGYADRALQTYAIQYGLIDVKNKTAKDNLRAKMQELYEFRFEPKKIGLDEYITSVSNRPIADPSSAVTPIILEMPAPTGGATATTVTPKTTTTTPTTVTTKPVATSTPSATATSTAKKAVVKKPVKKRRT